MRYLTRTHETELMSSAGEKRKRYLAVPWATSGGSPTRFSRGREWCMRATMGSAAQKHRIRALCITSPTILKFLAPYAYVLRGITHRFRL